MSEPLLGNDFFRIDAEENGLFLLPDAPDAPRIQIMPRAFSVTYHVKGGSDRTDDLVLDIGTLKPADTRSRLGDGTAIYIPASQDDWQACVASYPGLPFVTVQIRQPQGSGDAIDVARFDLDIAIVDAGMFNDRGRILGCDGLSQVSKPRASFLFLALTTGTNREGLVAGWLGSERGSGIVFSKLENRELLISARLEFGHLRLDPGQNYESEPFVLGRFDDCLDGLELYANAIAKWLSITPKPGVPSGYCTWYSRPNGGSSNEKAMGSFAAFAEKELVPFGFKIQQIDDGWQAGPSRSNPKVANPTTGGRRTFKDRGPRSDFTKVRARGPYKSGMKVTADCITQHGLTAGIWLMPFAWDPEGDALKDHNDWFVHRQDGKIYQVGWAGWCLDMTNPDARAFLAATIRRMTREWGYGYLKCDGLWSGMAVKLRYDPLPEYLPDDLGDATFHDPSKTNIEAFRAGLALVKETAGPSTYVLGCCIAQNMRTLGAAMGLVDGMRIGRDIGAKWEHIVTSAASGSRLYFLHGRVWHNDPDCLMLRKPLTIDQARAWASWIAVSGQLNIVSEWLPKLDKQQLDAFKQSIPNAGLCGRPVDLFENQVPSIWMVMSKKAAIPGQADVALFNWKTDNEKKISISFTDLDLDDIPRVGVEFWSGALLGPAEHAIEANVPPGSCLVFSIVPAAETPQLLGTSRHVLQGTIDVVETAWDEGAMALIGRSKVLKDDWYELRIHAQGFHASAGFASDASDPHKDDHAMRIDQSCELVRAGFKAWVSGEISWRIEFTKL
jgi:hypothetical protein